MTNIKESSIGHGLSTNKIYNMDCIEGMKLIPDGSIDAIITDPPYGTTACKWDTIIPFDVMREQLNRIIKPNGAIVLFGSEPFSSHLRMSNIKNYKYDWIWNKKLAGNFMLAKYQPMKIIENISVFNKHNYYPIKEYRDKMRKMQNTGTGETAGNIDTSFSGITKNWVYPKCILEYGNTNRKTIVHPTQKPVNLIEYLIKTYTNEGETVLDFTMGSGTTAIACLNTNRNFIGFELDEVYYNIANKRIQDRLSDNTLFS